MFALFCLLENKENQEGMDHLYNSVKFAKACFIPSLKVFVYDVISKEGYGVPPIVKLEE